MQTKATPAFLDFVAARLGDVRTYFAAVVQTADQSEPLKQRLLEWAKRPKEDVFVSKATGWGFLIHKNGTELDWVLYAESEFAGDDKRDAVQRIIKAARRVNAQLPEFTVELGHKRLRKGVV